jgi:CheY-like chemotaxis protein
MQPGPRPGASGASAADRPDDLIELLSRKVVGQPMAMQYIVPYIQMHRAGLAPAGRPAGIFLLLGPTGTGKTRTVEALAEVLHSTAKGVLRVDCGEFQADHEVAKLIGAPPGYLGHRETRPLLTQEKLREVTSSGCDLSLILFDEIEKAAPALSVLLLGILDKGTLRLGDNSEVDFEKSLIFLTSNLGAREMTKEVRPDLGFHAADQRTPGEVAGRLESIGLAAVRKRFSPEFVNRLDVVITYQPLDAEALGTILDLHIGELQRHVNTRLGDRSFDIDVRPAARDWLLRRGTSAEYGARELKRTIHRHLTQPLAALVASGAIAPGSLVTVDLDEAGESLSIRAAETVSPRASRRSAPTVLLLDDNQDLLEWLEGLVEQGGFTPVLAESAQKARQMAAKNNPDLAVLDVMLPDGDGISLAVELVSRSPGMRVIIMAGAGLSAEEAAICQRHDFPVLPKPFLGQDMLNLIQARMLHTPQAQAHSGR